MGHILAVNRTVEISNQALVNSRVDLSILLFMAGLIVGFGLGLNNGKDIMSKLVIKD
jgi:hypothetical protein